MAKALAGRRESEMNRYVVFKTYFDDLENRIDSAICTYTVGIADTLVEAMDFIKRSREEEGSFHKGWDGEEYPKWAIKEVPRIDKDTVPPTFDQLYEAAGGKLLLNVKEESDGQ